MKRIVFGLILIVIVAVGGLFGWLNGELQPPK